MNVEIAAGLVASRLVECEKKMSTLFRITALYNVYKRFELAERYMELRYELGRDVCLIMDMEERLHGPTEPTRAYTTKPLRRHISRTRLVDYHTSLLLSSAHKSNPDAKTTKIPTTRGYNHAS